MLKHNLRANERERRIGVMLKHNLREPGTKVLC